MHKVSIPKGARAVLLNLRYENHEAYVVGGCVRDSLLGKEPKDWDICTSATPDEVKELMHRRGIKTIDTGLQHGTVTVDMGTAGKYEVTTFRIDGNYTDGRHPAQSANGCINSVNVGSRSFWMCGWLIFLPMQRVHRSPESKDALHSVPLCLRF